MGSAANTQRVLIAAAAIAVVVLIVGIVWVYVYHVYAVDAVETCSPHRELVLATGFKGDVVVFGVLGALAAAALYAFMLRYQVFFPGADVKRILAAVAVCWLLALLLTAVDGFSGPECLKKALSPDSAIPDELASIRSFSGTVVRVGNVWLAVGLDQLLLALGFVVAVRLYREASLRYL